MGNGDREPVVAIAMPERGGEHHYGHRCRDAANLALQAFLDLFDATVTGDTVPVATVRRVAAAVMQAEGALGTYYDAHSDACNAHFELIKTERKRTDFFGRAITEPLVPLLNTPQSGFERANLPQFFHAVRLLLGESVFSDYNDRCSCVANELRGDGDFVPLDRFFADERVREIFEDTLVAIARAFKRFDARLDWFLIVMNTDPRTISLGSNVFIAKRPEDLSEHAFGDRAFARMFRALFASVRLENFPPSRTRQFVQRHGESPRAVFGKLFVALAELEQRDAGTDLGAARPPVVHPDRLRATPPRRRP